MLGSMLGYENLQPAARMAIGQLGSCKFRLWCTNFELRTLLANHEGTPRTRLHSYHAQFNIGKRSVGSGTRV